MASHMAYYCIKECGQKFFSYDELDNHERTCRKIKQKEEKHIAIHDKEVESDPKAMEAERLPVIVRCEVCQLLFNVDVPHKCGIKRMKRMSKINYRLEEERIK